MLVFLSKDFSSNLNFSKFSISHCTSQCYPKIEAFTSSQELSIDLPPRLGDCVYMEAS